MTCQACKKDDSRPTRPRRSLGQWIGYFHDDCWEASGYCKRDSMSPADRERQEQEEWRKNYS